MLQRRPHKRGLVLAAAGVCEIASKEVLNASNHLHGKAPVGQANAKPSALSTVLYGIDIVFGLVCQVLNKLSDTDDRQSAGQVTYHTVCLFGNIAVLLQQNCKHRAERSGISNATTTNVNSQKKKQPAKSKKSKAGRDTEAAAPSDTEEDVAIQMTRLLAMMALSLDLSCATHQNLLEGFLFILLKRVGQLLCLFVFQDLHRRPDLKITGTLKFPLPQGLAEATADDDAAIKGAHEEAKHLVWLLERVLVFLDAEPSSLSSLLLSSPTDTQARVDFVSRIKERLQSTLLQAVFGTDDPLFNRSLQHSVRPNVLELDSLHRYTQVAQQTVPDWFTQEIWRLLGWDMLANVERTTK